MTTPPRMTDATALSLHRARAQQDAMFLHHAAADEIEDRLLLVNKSFNARKIICGFPELWSNRFDAAKVVPDQDLLPIEPDSCDLVIHAMALHWANDPVGQLVQCRHALKPDGLLLCGFLGGQTLHELRASLAEAEAIVAGGISPRIAPMGEIRDLGALLQRAGFALPVADGTPLTASYMNAFHLMHDLRKMGETNAMADRIKHLTRRNIMTETASIYAEHFTNDDGRVDATFELITLTGWAPDDGQQKPLRPGSARMRLADALGAVEKPLDPSDT